MEKTDTMDARSLNKALSKKKQAGWLYINVGPLIALLVVIFTFSLWTMMILGITKGIGENILFAINGGLSTALGFILSFYFGTSKTESESRDGYEFEHTASKTKETKPEPDLENLPSPLDLETK